MPVKPKKEYTEAEVRAMRDTVYGTPITDKEWETCGVNWMKPYEILWLEAEIEIKNRLKKL